MAVYGLALKKLIPVPADGRDPRIKARVVILHVAVSEQPSLYAYFNGPSGGVESHFYVRRDGTVEQYRDTGWQADANTDANGFAISIETQGMAAGEWTAQQLAAIKALILWCHETHDIPLVKCPTWDGAGIGYHTLFRGTWDKRQASCPGPDRIKQFNNVLVPWLATGGQDDDMQLSDPIGGGYTIKDALNRIMGALPGGSAIGRVDASGKPARVLDTGDGGFLLAAIKADSVDPAAIAAAIPKEIAAQVADELAKRLAAGIPKG